MKSKVIRGPLIYDEQKPYKKREIEKAHPISQNQLEDAKLFTSKYEYAKTLNKNLSYLEIGVGFGYSAQIFISETSAISADLVDFYDNADGVRHPGGDAPEDSSITHEQHIKNKFSYHPNVNTIKGDGRDVLPTLDKKYDLILLDIGRERLMIRKLISDSSKLTNVGGIIGLTSYINYDSIMYEGHVGIYQSVNEFLYFNKNWSVDAIVLHDLGLHDIYIKRNS
jgi:predicted O-methyltransferase YrrM